MDPVTFELILAGASIGLQAINALTTRQADMTPEQQKQSEAMIAKFQGRIAAAQEMVKPYIKEGGPIEAPSHELYTGGTK